MKFIFSPKLHLLMANATIELPVDLASSLLSFIEENMQVKGKNGAEALITIVSAFEKGIAAVPVEPIDTGADF